jgi:hypothetical protein
MMVDGGINQKVQEYQMIMKSVFAAAAIVGAVALGSAGAVQADPRDSFAIGFDDGGWGGGSDYTDGGGDGYGWRRHQRRWEDPAPYRISCAQGRNIVASSGFRGVYANDCSAPVYRYTAWKRGEQFRVAVSVRGRIVAVNPIY